MRRVTAPLLLALAVAVLQASPALGAIYRGTGTDDPQMPVKVAVDGREVTFRYADVLVDCSDGSQVRQGGAVHAGRLNSENRFKDTLEVEGADTSHIDLTTSVVGGKVTARKAWGTVVYDLSYDGGECHSGEVRWSAKRR